MTAWETDINTVLKEFGITNRDNQPDAAERLQAALQDYTDLAREHSKMLKHFHCSDRVVEVSGTWCCPHCGKKDFCKRADE